METGWLCRHSPSAHSSVDLGVVLCISFAAGPISPSTNSAREKIERIRVSFASSPHFLQVLARPFCGHLGFGLIPRLRLEKEVSALDLNFWGGSLRSLFNHLIGWVPLLHQKHGSTNLQNRWKRGSCGRKASRRCSCCSKDKRTGKIGLNYSSRYGSSGILSLFFLAMCCVNGVLHVLCSASPRSPAFRESGHMYPFSPATDSLQFC